MKNSKPRPLPYYGGKSGASKAKWIASLLPWHKDSLYVETHGGSAGVLCARQPVNAEIYNDLDRRVVIWHRVLQEKPEELAWCIQCMPHSRQVFDDAQDTLLNPVASDLDRAAAYYVVATQSVAQDLNSSGGRRLRWIRRFNTNRPTSRWRYDRVVALADRFEHVKIENMDAVNLLTRLKNLAHAVIYVDPPYVTANRMPYLHSEVDVAALTEALHAQVGFVAISGQNNEWDHLDWNRYEKSAVVVPRPGQKHARKRAMVEVLWTNYEAHTERSNDQLEQLSIQDYRE